MFKKKKKHNPDKHHKAKSALGTGLQGGEAEPLNLRDVYQHREIEKKENCSRRSSDGSAAEEGDIDEVKAKVSHN